MLCTFKRLIYPKDSKNPEENSSGYMIAVYYVHERIEKIEEIEETEELSETDNNISEIKVVGYHLPTVEGIQVNITGKWVKNEKHGIQFKMDSYEEVMQTDRTSIVNYLSSGLIKGVGQKTAEKIYDMFGVQTLDILDNTPEMLQSISGITGSKLKNIRETYLASRDVRNIVTLLSPHGVSPNRAIKIYREFGVETIKIIRENPYKLCDMSGIGFITADKIALGMGFSPASDFRVDAALIHTLKEAESQGHLCLEKTQFIKRCVQLLDTEGVTFKLAGERAYILLKNDRLALYGNQVYRPAAAAAEINVAENVNERILYGSVNMMKNLDAVINREEKKLGLKLADEQKEAVKTCLTSRLCIITGGPGTGKTLIQRVLLSIFKKQNPGAKIVCCAPTGRAARRMEQCTGFPSSTIHKTLGLLAGEAENVKEAEPIDADLILVDEFSMVDIYLASHLLKSAPLDSQVILIGDADQLPSVGPGAVLSELIACGRVPFVRLDKVFRQNEGSRIAVNAKLIRHNKLNLEYGDDFQFINSKNYEDSADIIEKLYQTEVNSAGLDNVALLTPFRSKTATGVNALNERLREKVNPAAPDKPEAANINGKRTFRLGDKVMQIKNQGEVNNGDVGYITDISGQGRDIRITVDYGDGRTPEYDAADFDILEFAYAGTVHKSQGSEYSTVIINIQNGHFIMLKRPLIYTAVTRAKQRVIIVGDRKALCMAIRTNDAEVRGTMLAERINSHFDAAAAIM